MRIVTFGETMLRLKSPGAERFFQSPSLEATFGGSESNVAVSLSLFGEDASFVTVFPDNPLADAAVASLRGFGVDTSGIVRVPGRMGLYFVESGACQRAGRIVYDRADSALALAPPDAIDWPTVLDGAYLLHLTGITPSISARAADAAILAAATAKEMGVRVSLDFNLRMNLWKYGKLPIEVIPILLMYADICIANEEQIAIALGLELEGGAQSTGAPDPNRFARLTEKVAEIYPNIRVFATTLRETVSADRNRLSAALRTRESFCVSRTYEISDIVDRIGAGDAFDAGLIYGLTHFAEPSEALEFAAAAAVLKHSVPGDLNLATLDEVAALAFGGADGRIKR
ncbi:MAG: sugar kinase [Thermoguttaceae bacterium]|nr:sugar kinase [Thermoguttaceae bacterium]